ncbi:MAG TPA: pyridoxal-phosphate dependent enzyme [Cellvibrionaceae bacterium]|nr:pyridoxal-phosphate dependent enzyme [Cellvibrionaceae bacterium]
MYSFEASPLFALAQRAHLQPVTWSCAAAAHCRIWIKRDDLLHAAVSGNKLFKLFHHLLTAKKSAARGLLSFGGAYSNHLYAMAQVAKAQQLPAVAIIRGTDADLENPTLARLRNEGMQLMPVSREQYRLKMQPSFIEQLKTQFSGFYLIPEGGAGFLGAQGFVDYAQAVSAQLLAQDITVDAVWLPAGTGTSVAGLAACWHNVHAVGALAMQDRQPYVEAVEVLRHQLAGVDGAHGVSWHGFDIPFGKTPASIIEICRAFWDETGVLFDPIYGGKLLLALQKAFSNGLRHQQILIIHTGGNQGWQGVFNRTRVNTCELQDAFSHYMQNKTQFLLQDSDLTLGI